MMPKRRVNFTILNYEGNDLNKSQFILTFYSTIKINVFVIYIVTTASEYQWLIRQNFFFVTENISI